LSDKPSSEKGMEPRRNDRPVPNLRRMTAGRLNQAGGLMNQSFCAEHKPRGPEVNPSGRVCGA
jgi:hypothetical protein